jgi:hypothetical protein
MSTRAIFSLGLCFFVASPLLAGDKKEMIVAAGEAARQINNHYWSYTTPGRANTNCSGSGTVNATGTTVGSTTTVNGTVSTDSNCNTTYTPPQTMNGNRITVDNSAWVTDTATGDQYLIQCTANWRGSKCSYLTGGTYKAALEGNDMWITGMKGMKEATAKYHVLRFIPAPPRPPSVPAAVAVGASAPTVASTPPTASGLLPGWPPDETYAWETYKNASPEDKDYIRVFCTANPKGGALIPRAKVIAAQEADHSVDCTAWLAAKAKAE